MDMKAIFGLVLIILLIGVLIYVFVFAERREYPNNTARENIDFATKSFDDSLHSQRKIQDFDVFKYSGFDVKSPVYTYTNTKSAVTSNPYSKANSNGINPIVSLNSTIQPVDISVDTVGSALPVKPIIDGEFAPSLTGLNANIESTIRESMVKSELRRSRR